MKMGLEGPPPPQANLVSPPSVPAIPSTVVALRYLGRSAITLRGLATDHIYSFSQSQSVQQIDSRDAEAFLRTRYFRRHHPS